MTQPRNPSSSRPPVRRPSGGPAARPSSLQRKRKLRIPVASSSKRIRIFAFLLVGVLGLSSLRAFQLQALDPAAYADTAKDRLKNVVALQAERGSITDRNGVVLAASEPAVNVIADPMMIMRNGVPEEREMTAKEKAKAEQAPGAVAAILAKYLGGRAADFLPDLTIKDSKYKVIETKVPAYTFEQLDAAMADGGWYGIYDEPNPVRTYPAGSLASNVVGFVDYQGIGKAGLEYSLNADLTGVDGTQIFEYGKWGRIPTGQNVITPAVNGNSYQLTLDAELQWMAEKALADGVANAKGDYGIAVVMNAKTGEILAMANTPSYDSNDPGASENADLGNRAVTATYEPGSVEKILTMAILADSGTANPDTKVVTPGQIRSGGGYVEDAWAHGTMYLTARGMVAKSSNVAAVTLGRQVDKATFNKYLSSFGLGAKTGVGLPGESTGEIPGADMADYTRDQISFGSGMSVTAVQMAAAVAGIVNGGVYNQPTILASGTDADGNPVDIGTPKSKRIISEEASAMVLDAMEAVMTEGGGKNLAIEGFRTAGKTGTASRYDTQCQCYKGYTSSFVGVAPADDPQLVVYVVVDNPTKGHFGAAVAGPIYQDIMEVALGRYGVMPSTTQPDTGALEYEP